MKAYSSFGSRYVNIQIPNSLPGSHNDSSMVPPCKRYTLVSQPEIAKKYIKAPIWRSRSFKVIEFGANQQSVYGFLLVINSNPLRIYKMALRFLKLESSTHPTVKIW